MKRILIIFFLFFLTNCTYDKNVAINNVKYQKAKSECVWKGYYKMDDQFNKCIKEKMSNNK